MPRNSIKIMKENSNKYWPLDFTFAGYPLQTEKARNIFFIRSVKRKTSQNMELENKWQALLKAQQPLISPPVHKALQICTVPSGPTFLPADLLFFYSCPFFDGIKLLQNLPLGFTLEPWGQPPDWGNKSCCHIFYSLFFCIDERSFTLLRKGVF